MRLGQILDNYSSGLTVVELARQADGKSYKSSGVERKIPDGMSRVDLDVRPIGKHDVIFKNYDYGEPMSQAKAKRRKRKKDKKETSTHVQTRPSNPLFQNYDYGGAEEGSETSPGTGLYHGKMDKYKSVKDFLDKAKKRPHATKKAWEWLYLMFVKNND